MRLRFVVCLSLWAQCLAAQISEGGLSPRFSATYQDFLTAQKTAFSVLALPNLQQARLEDAAQQEQARFAVPVAADIAPDNGQGSWTTLPDSSRLWTCGIKVPGALALIVLFDEFDLPLGARLYASDLAGRRKLGAYTQQSGTDAGTFTIGTLPGDAVVLELHLPVGVAAPARLHINRVDYAYHRGALSEGDPWAASDYGQSLTCNLNVNCPEGNNWQTEKKGIARILMVFGNGSAWCSGSLVANTSGNSTPYFLSAHHCQILLSTPQFSQWIFYFDYEAPTCANPASEPNSKSVLGCQRMAFSAATDMLLLQLSAIPSNYNLYYNGWSRATTPASSSAFIHHPQGDIKKISIDNHAAVSHPQSINWGGIFGVSQPNTHWKLVPDAGIFEPGSSGCPMFDQNKRITGQLHGGVSNACNITAAYFGMFHLSWEGNTPGSRLKDWLDPAGTNPNTLNGYVQPANPINIGGNLACWWGPVMKNHPVMLSGAVTDTVWTDTLGNYIFSDLVAGLNYTVTPLIDPDAYNGVSTLDLGFITRHLIASEVFTTPWQYIAADVNSNNSVSSFDIVETRKLLIGVFSTFPNAPSWRFFPANLTFSDPANPFASVLPAGSLSFTALQQSMSGVNFKSVKMGDLNQSAQP